MASPESSYLYLSNKPDACLLRALEGCGWTAVLPPPPLTTVKHDPSLRVGLIDLRNNFNLAILPIIEHMLCAPQRAWVMLATAQQIAMPVVCQLIEKYCSDYWAAESRAECIASSLEHARRMIALSRQEPLLHSDVVIGNSAPMQRLSRCIAKVAATNAPVFIYGESGTGKELSAASIVGQSRRPDGPYIAINCGAIPHSLIHSELFGYERGAFTGATQQRIGKIEAAHTGTLFLDEIGDLPLDSQANLLRFLQEGQIQRIGSHKTIDVDVRVICATNVDIERAVANKRFRSDLFHRLCVLRIDQPPLRVRGGDIELIATHMLERFRGDSQRRIRGFSSCAVSALYSYTWPGNVRELINRVRRAVVMAEGRAITAEDLDLTQFVSAKMGTLGEVRKVAEQAAIEQALRRHRNRLSEAAQELGISRVTLYRLMGSPFAHERSEEARKASRKNSAGSLRK